MKRVSFRTRYPAEIAHPIHRRIIQGSAVSSAQLVAWGPATSTTTLSWFDGDRAGVAELLEPIDAITTLHLSADADGTYAFVDQARYGFDAPTLELLSEAKVAFVPPVTFRDTGEVFFEAVGESRDLGEFHARASRMLDTSIETVHDYRRSSSPSALTTRQRAALETAVAVGYYEIPRTGTVEDIAAELGCARSTAGELLRKGESAIINGYVSSRSPSESDGAPS